jgi:hypothetical protein
MKRIVAMAVLVTALVVGVLPAQAHVRTQRYSPNTTWHTFTGVPPAGDIGHAQTVCLNASAPANCPAGATLYGFGGTGWAAPLASIPHAFWIWAPGITGATSPSELAQYSFSKRVRLHGRPVFGQISIAADDFAEVSVNGSVVGTIGSITNSGDATTAQNTLTTFDIKAFLHRGRNRITVRAQNGPGSYSGCGPCTYAQQPAGVVFGVKIKVRVHHDDD